MEQLSEANKLMIRLLSVFGLISSLATHASTLSLPYHCFHFGAEINQARSPLFSFQFQFLVASKYYDVLMIRIFYILLVFNIILRTLRLSGASYLQVIKAYLAMIGLMHILFEKKKNSIV